MVSLDCLVITTGSVGTICSVLRRSLVASHCRYLAQSPGPPQPPHYTDLSLQQLEPHFKLIARLSSQHSYKSYPSLVRPLTSRRRKMKYLISICGNFITNFTCHIIQSENFLYWKVTVNICREEKKVFKCR